MLSQDLARRNEIGSYRITVSGIQIYEEDLAPSIFNSRVEERRMILETLQETYNHDVKQWTSHEELIKRIKTKDIYRLAGTVEYLEKVGYVKLNKFHGGKFFIKLTAQGFQSLQVVTIDNSRVMSVAYKTLFQLENRLRQFIESKLRSKYGSDWWSKCVSMNIKKKVDEMRQTDSSLGWQLSTTVDNTDFLLFEHLEKIIIRNWEDVFKSVFHDQHKISLRLGELVVIRNSIAHTRILSQGGMDTLYKYSQDLLNMIK